MRKALPWSFDKSTVSQAVYWSALPVGRIWVILTFVTFSVCPGGPTFFPSSTTMFVVEVKSQPERKMPKSRSSGGLEVVFTFSRSASAVFKLESSWQLHVVVSAARELRKRWVSRLVIFSARKRFSRKNWSRIEAIRRVTEATIPTVISDLNERDP
ncbi:MAG: hypothetical protein HC902_01115 [Calothrix sp. SM1_5_4]|nr:hypothetical protein [Calothrix sp. SM1_5_4]